MSTRECRQAAIAAALVLLAAALGRADEPARFVDPFVGTGGHGHTFPGPSLPFGMVQVGPDTRLTGWDGCSGYHYSDETVYGFSHTHLSGTGVSDLGDVLLLPATGETRLRTGYEKPAGTGYGSRFRHAAERAEPGYYSVELDSYGVRAELSATKRAGFHRYTFPASDSAHVLVDLQHRDTVIESSLRVVSATEIEGMRRSRAWAEDQRVYFVARFSKPFVAELAVDDEPRPGLGQASGRNVKAVLRYRTGAGEAVLVKVGLSGTGTLGARRNLEAEIPGWDFDAVRAAARAAWNDALGRIEVEGGTPAQRTVFYTALYHSLLAPNLFMDVDGRYLGTDREVHRAEGFENYSVFSLWDTFRAEHPLLTLLEPRRTVDFVRTFLAQEEHWGHLPVWELWANETWCMIGYHAVPVIADAYLKGLRGFDAERALAAMKRSAEADRFGLGAYRRFGFIPYDREAESVSKTLEYAYDDWTIATMARSMGREQDYRRFARRAQAWRHLLDPATGFIRPRGHGRWLTPFDPFEVSSHYTEANAWQYSLFVPHDVSGLMGVLGGEAKLLEKLDALFSAPLRTTGREQPDISGLIGQYAHGNEPSHHMAYLYAFAGQPGKTQRLIRRILDEMYAPRPDGLIGNEDCGQMSAWYVMSAMGFYPVTPGAGYYVVGTPLFPKLTLRLPGGRQFVIRADGVSERNLHIRSARLDGRPYSRAFVDHADLVKGGELAFEMGDQPDPSWGTGPGDRPVTATDDEPVLPAPFVAAGERSFTEGTRVELGAVSRGARIHYTLDGTEPTAASPVYSGPIPLDRTATLRFVAVTGSGASPVAEADFLKRAEPWRIELRTRYRPQYPAGGDGALVDGFRGGEDFRSGEWQGYEGTDLDAVVDMGAERQLRRVGVGFVQNLDSWVFLPREVVFEVSSDGRRFSELGRVASDVPLEQAGSIRKDFLLEAGGARARYLRVVGRSIGVCPPWHKGAGQPAWVFADEILIE